MKLTAVGVLKWNGQQEPYLLGFSSDLSSFGFFQRGTVKEMLTFVARTVVQRTHTGQRQTVKHEEYYCHVHVRESGLAGVTFVDKDYPSRAAFGIIGKVLDDFEVQNASGDWKRITQDDPIAQQMVEQALLKYQDPTQADQLLKIQKDLDETKVILHQTIEGVLERGEKLDNLVDKSHDLSMASQMFYKQARKSNRCCSMM
eukprot:TRINITY_DN2620_c0_g1_i1.p2 TRINITY_DN2620_c0_g1~~TRINITY_DN2620_c0_g1_i1.p2  ORF type:complete len:201 (-),score=31.99 TRINITY_DN2620_c0_g1_i1:300-902(-)